MRGRRERKREREGGEGERVYLLFFLHMCSCRRGGEGRRRESLYSLLFLHMCSCRQFQHENLVKLYGVCTKQGPIFIVQELMVNGKQERNNHYYIPICLEYKLADVMTLPQKVL